ncbi:hypothetical protein D3P09_03140 [Paenibacillus pinisoli]|uniref:Helicase XPB/Ssl2 N-terminal domain-containing protein n=1 Tax=Paenibacillus pinisoli TaxID=1276110 RepID=A0A3A6Q583_9BACL|nr:helicase-associated domain-containing protein [Paenibacillus pinisoli]RJX41024.1 hypothetical protein D3P09_03140 [Paenibacillus pinisoli]
MNLSQASAKLSEERIKQFESAPAWEGILVRGLSWRAAMQDRDAVQEAYGRLSSSANEALAAMILRFGAAPVEEERLLTELKEHTALSGAEARIGLGQLQEAGIVLVAAKLWGDRSCFIPADSFPVWQQALFPCAWSDSNAPVQPLMDASGQFVGVKEPFGRRLLYMLAALMKSETDFTSKGVLPKKTIQRLQNALGLEEELLKAFPWSVPRSENYPLPVGFGLAAAAAAGLLNRDEQGASADPEGLQSWFGISDNQRERALLLWACGYMVRASKENALIGAALTSASSELWLSANELADWGALLAERSGTAQDGGRNIRSTVERWLYLWHELGWIELAERYGPDNGMELVFRKREFQDGIDSQLIVQPTGELLAVPGSSFAMRWELELIAERAGSEEPVLYRLTASSVAAALEQGRSKDGIASFLRKASGEAGLPVQLLSMLEQWSGRACRYSFEQATLLRCDTAELAEEAMRLTGISPHLIERIGEKHFMVNPAAVSEIRGLLNKAGYPPRKGILQALEGAAAAYPHVPEPGMGAVSCWKEGRTRQSEAGEWLYEPQPLQHFALDLALPAYSVTLLPCMDQVPAAWWRQLRSYHASTRKELIQQAVAMETAVQLKLAGELRQFVPERIELRGAQWAVTGKLVDDKQPERSRLTPDMWEEMKLVLPSGLTL